MEQKIQVPDIGSSNAVDVIEILVKVGDTVNVDTPLITLESDKASMEIPCPQSGIVKSIALKIGDKVKQGDLILLLEAEETVSVPETVNESKVVEHKNLAPVTTQPAIIENPSIPQSLSLDNENKTHILAGPAVRRLARTFGVKLELVQGSGRKARITIEDLEAYIKKRLQDVSENTGLNLSAKVNTVIDFSQFGPIEQRSLSKIKRISGQNLHNSWLQVPHVTQFELADITDLESFRKEQAVILEKDNVKLTLLAFICKAVCKALLEFPEFNASLSPDAQELILKKYIHIGIAVDTPQGLVVPVIKNAQLLSIRELAICMAELSSKARQKLLTPADMSGGSFTISSLGGIGGTAFTPIVNFPEVAILGVSKATIQPIYQAQQFIPRLMLPLSLSYDHRVIDGAQGARFAKYLSMLLSDIRKIML